MSHSVGEQGYDLGGRTDDKAHKSMSGGATARAGPDGGVARADEQQYIHRSQAHEWPWIGDKRSRA